MKKCDICGHINDDTQLFCGQCGNKLTNITPSNQFPQQPPIQNNPQQNTSYQYNNNPQEPYYQPSNNDCYNPQQQYPPIIVEKKKPHGCLVTLAVFGVIFLLIIILGSCGPSLSESTKTTVTASSGTESTKSPKAIKEDFIKSCESFTYKEIARNPNNYKGKHAKFKGEVIQVIESGDDITLRVNITAEENNYSENGYTYFDTIYVEYTRKDENESRILEDDIINIYGTLNGIKDYSSILGSEVSCPYLIAEYIDIENV